MKIKDRWNYITDPRSDEGPKILSKDWFILILSVLGILGFITLLVLIFGDRADEIIELLGFGGFVFLMGTAFGLHRGRTMNQ